MRGSQYVLIPILAHRENIQTHLNFIEEILSCKPITEMLLIINQTTGDQFEQIRRPFKHFYPELAIFNLKKSSAFAWMTERKKSIAELVAEYKLFARHFRVVAEQFEHITDHMMEISGYESV